jgi:UDPglucose 6-dehydrogenase
VVASNDARKVSMVSRVTAACGGNVRGKTVAVLGLTFKPNTDDMRDSPSLVILPRLIEQGAKVRAFDPEGMSEARKQMPEVEYCASAEDAMAGADCLLLLTEWNEFRALDPRRIKALLGKPVVVDLRNVYNPAEMRGAGLTYTSIGRPNGSVSEPA